MRHLFAYPKIKFLFIIVLLFVSFKSLGQNIDLEASKEYIKLNQKKYNLSDLDIKTMVVSSSYISPTTGWYHIYYNQTFQNIDVFNGMINLTLKNGHLLHMANSFIPNIENNTIQNPINSKLKPIDALLRASKSLNLNSSGINQIKSLNSTNNIDGKLVKETFQDKSLSNENIEVKLYWYSHLDTTSTKPMSKVDLVYSVKFVTLDHQDAWNVMVDSESGKIIETKNEVIKCNFGNKNDHSHLSKKNEIDESSKIEKNPLVNNSYTVFNYPIESPSHGSRSTVTQPYSNFVPIGTGPGSTNGWHEDGTNSFIDTRGNNVYAQEDANGDDSGGIRPSSSTLEFNYPYALGLGTALANQNASITNLFFWNNLIHDVLWKMGFDEPSGNFQTNNMNRGGQGNDYVFSDAQDGSGTNNANFYTPVDGSSPRMQMFLWNYPSSYQADSDFDNAIIAHEYGHGWSIRLTGGPNTTSCLWNAEQGGEGWSDYLGLMLTTNWGSLTPTLSSANIRRGIGTYVLGQPTSGLGIRPFPYSYDMANANPQVTYAGVSNSSLFSQPHGIGSIWATMLWDMTWNIILQDQLIIPDIYNTSNLRGNVAALKLVNEGLRLQPCSPSFVDARNAILAADAALFNGRYACAIGNAFARRGLGALASTGISSNDRIVNQDFTPFSDNFLISPKNINTCSGDSLKYIAISSKANSTYSWQRNAVSGISNPAAMGNSPEINEVLINTTSNKINVTYVFTLSPDSCGLGVPNFVTVTVNPAKILPIVGQIEVCLNGIQIPNLNLQMPIQNKINSKKGSLSSSDPIFTRPSSTGASGTVRTYYKFYSFVPNSNQSVKFNLNSSDFDTFLFLYQGTFNPNSPTVNFLAGNDDSNSNTNSEINFNLLAGQTYTIVCCSWNNYEIGNFEILANSLLFNDEYSWYLTQNSPTSIFSGNSFNPVGVPGSNIPNLLSPITQDYFVSLLSNSQCRSKTNFTISNFETLNVIDGIVNSDKLTCAITNDDTLNLSGNSSNVLGWYSSTNNFETQSFISNTTTKLNYKGLVEDTKFRALINKGACKTAYSQPAEIKIIHPSRIINNNEVNKSDSIRAGNFIISKSIIDSTSRIKYQASKYITLDTNFSVQEGGVFETQLIENECYTPVTLIIKPDSTNSNDTEISSLFPNNNYASNRYLVPFAWNQFGSSDIRRSLLKFDLSSIPEDAIIDSAFLSLYYSQFMISENPPFTGHFGDNALEIIRINSDWNANTVTWANQPDLINTNKINISRTLSQTQDYPKINITSIVRNQIGNNNNGILIKHVVESAYRLTSLTSSEEENPLIRPKLVVYYRYK